MGSVDFEREAAFEADAAVEARQLGSPNVADFLNDRTFCAQGLKILDNLGRLVPLVWNRQQEKLHETIERQRIKGKPVRLRILKYRRGGLSTGIAGKLFKATAFQDGQSAVIVAHDKSAASNLFRIYDRFRQHYRPVGGKRLPEVLRLNQGAESGSIEFDNDSAIRIATAKNADFARSFNYRRVHLSERAFYPNIRALTAGLAATVPDDPETWVIEETTANGYNEFYNDWMASVEHKTAYEALFFGCFEDPENWRALDQPADLFQKTLTDEEWELKQRYSLHLEQIHWRRKKIGDDYKGDVMVFDQEYPHSWEVAFMTSGRPKFSPKFFIHMPLSDGFRCELEELDLGRGKKKYTTPANEYGSLTIWDHPEVNEFYVGGVDPSRGLDINEGVGTPDPDYSVAEIFNAKSYDHVAELRERIEPVALARYLFDLGNYYNAVYWVIEVEPNGGNGLSVIRELQRLGYPNHLIYHMETVDEDTQRPTHKPGYIITGKSKQTLMSTWERMLMDHDVILRSKQAVAEHRTFVKKPNSSVGAASGSHDDCVMACMYGGFALENGPKRSVTSTEKAAPFGAYVAGVYGLTQSERVRGVVEKPGLSAEDMALRQARRKLM